MADREQNLGKVVKMPDAEELIRRLPAGTYGLTRETDAFYKRLAESLGGSERVGGGINMAWELASYDTLRTYPSIMRTMVNMNFEAVVDAIIPDPEVAEQAKEFRRKVIEEAQRQAKATEPTSESLAPADSLADFTRYSQVRRVADVVFEHVATRSRRGNSDVTYMEDRRKEEANPFYKQTHSGILLEGYYGQLNRLWTPWGEYGFGGSGMGDWKEVTPVILEKFGAVEKVPQRDTEMGSIGPIYSLHKLDGIALPNPVERPRSQFAPYDEVKQTWKALTQRYNKQQSAGQNPRNPK